MKRFNDDQATGTAGPTIAATVARSSWDALRGMTDLEILKAARTKIARGWTQGCMARNVLGLEVGCCTDTAVEFCAAGAIWSANQWADPGYLLGSGADIVKWNDAPGRTQDDVLVLFDARISALSVRP